MLRPHPVRGATTLVLAQRYFLHICSDLKGSYAGAT